MCLDVLRVTKHKNGAELIMSRITLVIAVLAELITPAFAQKAEIEAVNAKWIEFFNKGDWAGVASLCTGATGTEAWRVP